MELSEGAAAAAACRLQRLSTTDSIAACSSPSARGNFRQQHPCPLKTLNTSRESVQKMTPSGGRQDVCWCVCVCVGNLKHSGRALTVESPTQTLHHTGLRKHNQITVLSTINPSTLGAPLGPQPWNWNTPLRAALHSSRATLLSLVQRWLL